MGVSARRLKDDDHVLDRIKVFSELAQLLVVWKRLSPHSIVGHQLSVFSLKDEHERVSC